jgi:branched-chain amino acid transport system ATP-binding protein
MLLELKGVTTYQGFTRAIHDVSLKVAENEIVSLLGANGAGKTTLLLTISGILKPSGGKILLQGSEIQGLPPHRIVKLGISQSPEDRKLFGKMTVLKNLKLGSYTLRLNKKETETTLEQIWQIFPILRERVYQTAATLSGGEQKMLSIARALMARPRILALDEPSLGLAPKIIHVIMDTVRSINQAGTTILMVEQNASAALRIANRGYVLEAGRIVLEGTRTALLEDEGIKRAYLGA